MCSVSFSRFLHKVAEYEKNQRLAELVYLQAVKELRCDGVTEDICNLKKSHMNEIIKPFLVTWGEMGRHIKQLTESDWEELLHNLQDAQKAFKGLKGKTLLNADFDALSDFIKCLFKAMEVNHVGATSKSKILHLLNPELFVMWDDRIRKEGRYQNTAEGYIKFLKTMKSCAEKIVGETGKSPIEFIDAVYRELQDLNTHRKTLAKLVDEYNMQSTPVESIAKRFPCS